MTRAGAGAALGSTSPTGAEQEGGPELQPTQLHDTCSVVTGVVGGEVTFIVSNKCLWCLYILNCEYCGYQIIFYSVTVSQELKRKQ